MTLGQSGPESNGNEEVLHIPQNSRMGASPSDGLMLYPGHMGGCEVLPLRRDAVGVFYSPSQTGLSQLDKYASFYICMLVGMKVGWKVHIIKSYLLLMAFLTNGMQALQHRWSVEC